jgi:hypothetical protein
VERRVELPLTFEELTMDEAIVRAHPRAPAAATRAGVRAARGNEPGIHDIASFAHQCRACRSSFNVTEAAIIVTGQTQDDDFGLV